MARCEGCPRSPSAYWVVWGRGRIGLLHRPKASGTPSKNWPEPAKARCFLAISTLPGAASLYPIHRRVRQGIAAPRKAQAEVREAILGRHSAPVHWDWPLPGHKEDLQVLVVAFRAPETVLRWSSTQILGGWWSSADPWCCPKEQLLERALLGAQADLECVHRVSSLGWRT
jgi:hypothetical protein